MIQNEHLIHNHTLCWRPPALLILDVSLLPHASFKWSAPQSPAEVWWRSINFKQVVWSRKTLIMNHFNFVVLIFNKCQTAIVWAVLLTGMYAFVKPALNFPFFLGGLKKGLFLAQNGPLHIERRLVGTGEKGFNYCLFNNSLINCSLKINK